MNMLHYTTLHYTVLHSFLKHTHTHMQVVVRARPMNGREKDMKCKNMLTFAHKQNMITITGYEAGVSVWMWMCVSEYG
jgi:hypothetical protein